jgi:hypothetical protein
LLAQAIETEVAEMLAAMPSHHGGWTPACRSTRPYAGAHDPDRHRRGGSAPASYS